MQRTSSSTAARTTCPWCARPLTARPRRPDRTRRATLCREVALLCREVALVKPRQRVRARVVLTTMLILVLRRRGSCGGSMPVQGHRLPRAWCRPHGDGCSVLAAGRLRGRAHLHAGRQAQALQLHSEALNFIDVHRRKQEGEAFVKHMRAKGKIVSLDVA